MAMFLLKTEPSEYSYSDLVREKRCVWSGVSNPGALIALRAIRKGDEIFVYHTGNERAIVGLAKAASNPYEDPGRPGTTDEGKPKFAVVDLSPGKPAKSPVTLAKIKDDTRFATFGLVKQSRLSAMPVPEALAKVLREWMGL